MQIHVKVLQGQECSLEVMDDIGISELKKIVCDKLGIPVHQQKLLVTGKPLTDDKKISDYPIKDGTKINLVILKADNTSTRKETTVLRDAVFNFLRKFYNEGDSKKVTDEFMKEFNKSLSTLSLDDLERIAAAYLQEENKSS